MRPFVLLLSALLAVSATAQDLRRGLVESDAVVVGRQVGKKPHGDELVLHRVQVLRDVRGAAGAAAVTVIDWPNLSLHNRPQPRQSRLYCLVDASGVAERLGLPAAEAPYYRMAGWSGTNPLVGADLDADAFVGLATLLARSEAGAPSQATAAGLFDLSLARHPVVRLEATKLLAERPDLCTHLQSVQWSNLVARASGEVEDVPYKIALAELCAERRLEGLLDALVVSLGPVDDPEYARTVGRIAKLLHGEEATARLEARLRTLAEPKDRAAVLLAIGATNTESALDALLRRNQGPDRDPAVEAALREHRSPRAKEASLKKSGK
ncbi:MAG: hypothetical protein RL398_1221 [Planctomycetota bacterium]|jgi:hypothetical protein